MFYWITYQRFTKRGLKNNQVDFVLYNEGVYGLLELLQTNFKDNLNNVSSLGYKKDDQLILNPLEK